MTLKTVTGPSLRQALADARRLFGDDVVLLQSSPATAGGAASVTVAFDDGPPRPRRRLVSSAPAAAAVPEGGAAVAPRPYGYPVVRKEAPAAAPLSAPPPASDESASSTGGGPGRGTDAREGGVVRRVPPRPLGLPAPPLWGEEIASQEGSESGSATLPAPRPAYVSRPVVVAPVEEPAPPTPAPPAVSVEEVDALRARLADLEARLASLPTAAPAPAPEPPAPPPRPLVFVGAGGSGKTSLALRLALAPGLVGAERPAVIVVAPDAEHAVDPAPTYWRAGVPVAVVRTADEVREALDTFEGADRIVVDTPGLPLLPERAAPVVRYLGEVLAPLAAVDVCLVVEASRAPATLAAETVAALGLRPDALALTRLDEVAGGVGDAWAQRLGLGVRFASAGPGVGDLSANAHPAPAEVVPPAAPPTAPSAAAPFATPALEDVVLVADRLDVGGDSAPPAAPRDEAPPLPVFAPVRLDDWAAPLRPTDAVTA